MWHGRVMAGHGTHNKEIVCLTHSNSMSRYASEQVAHTCVSATDKEC